MVRTVKKTLCTADNAERDLKRAERNTVTIYAAGQDSIYGKSSSAEEENGLTVRFLIL